MFCSIVKPKPINLINWREQTLVLIVNNLINTRSKLLLWKRLDLCVYLSHICFEQVYIGSGICACTQVDLVQVTLQWRLPVSRRCDNCVYYRCCIGILWSYCRLFIDCSMKIIPWNINKKLFSVCQNLIHRWLSMAIQYVCKIIGMKNHFR